MPSLPADAKSTAPTAASTDGPPVGDLPTVPWLCDTCDDRPFCSSAYKQAFEAECRSWSETRAAHRENESRRHAAQTGTL
jgi:hypothetical protein